MIFQPAQMSSVMQAQEKFQKALAKVQGGAAAAAAE